jgi:hypothetical protein
MRSPQAFRHVVATDSALASWDARRRREEALTAILRRHLPRPLAERIRVADAQGQELCLAAEAGAVAAVTRQRAPDLLASLQRDGWQFTGIRVRVQVRAEPVVHKQSVSNPIDRSAFEPLAGLARDLPNGPLKAALTRFLRRAG